MPGLDALRSASSSSSSTHTKSHTAESHHQRHGTIFPSAPTPVPRSSRAMPAFHTVRNPDLLVVPTAQPIRFKQITDPSTDARLHDTSTLNYSSSGSPHDDPNTVCLAAMVHEFLEEEIKMVSCGRARCNCVDGVCGDDDETCTMPEEAEEAQSSDDHFCEILEGITSCTSKPELLLLVDVARAVEVESEELAAIGGDDGAVMTERLRRLVMKRLRQEGYNAAICKSRWKHADGLPAGDYEYIDIVMDGKGSKKQERFIVDIDFRAQFEIARASKQYVQLLGVLPRLFVGRAESRLKQILKIMSNAAKCSLKQQGLLLPPWRKHKYMQAKWLSPYRRTTNSNSRESISSCLQADSQHLLGLGLRAPKFLSLDFTKEMDLLFYKAQGLNSIHEQFHAHKTRSREANVGIIRSGFAATGTVLEYLPSQYIEAPISSGRTCTDWQLPAVDEKCRRGGGGGGISTALKQATLLSNEVLLD